MRILIAHNEYQQKGGEDAVVRNEAELLKTHGHEVFVHLVSNHSIQGVLGGMKAAWNLSYSNESRMAFGCELDRIRPDIVHVHNFFPLLTPSIYDACQDRKIPVVQSLHNFRVACSNGLLLRDGKICEDCLGKSPYSGVLHGCYRGSALATLPVARMIDNHQRKGTWKSKVHRFIATTPFTAEKFAKAGIPKEKISVKPNFIFGPNASDLKSSRSYAQPTGLFVGRLSEEKGVRTLLEAWKGLDLPLRIIGEGPLLNEIQAERHPKISAPGKWATPDEVRQEMSQCDFLIIPSECYENFPVALVEAYATGLPVIGSSFGSMRYLIDEGKTGYLFHNGKAEELRQKAILLAADREKARQMGQNARQVYEENYSPERNYEILISIYRQVL